MIVAAIAMAGGARCSPSKLLPAYTEEGRRLEDEIEGLRQYLSVAEGDELARMKMPPRTKEEFAKFLPYAVALEVEKTWAEAFAKVLGAAALAQATAGYYSTSSSDGYSELRALRRLDQGHGHDDQLRLDAARQQLGQFGFGRQQRQRRGRILRRRRRRGWWQRLVAE